MNPPPQRFVHFLIRLMKRRIQIDRKILAFLESMLYY